MVETEKVCNHKVTSVSSSELIQSKRSNISPTNVSPSRRPTITRSTSAYYVFASLPQVVHSVRPKTGYRNNVSRPRGAHDYYNVMWDPHIYRGTTTTFTSSLKQPDSESRREEERSRKRRGFASNPSGATNNVYNNSISPTGMGNRQRYRMTTKVSSRSRTFPPPQLMNEGRHQVQVQTDEYLEDLTRDAPRPEVDAVVQTDPVQDELIHIQSESGGKRRLILSEKSGIDASTQVLPGELVTFDEQVQPIVEALVGKILEQALMETMEEEEIWALKAQQNRFLEKRKEEEQELSRLREQQERISAEKERLKSHIQAQLLQQQNGDAEALFKIMNRNSGGEAKGPNENPMILNTSYLLELLPSVINSLRQEGLLTDQAENDISQSLAKVLEKEIGTGEESWDDNVEMEIVEAIEQDASWPDANEIESAVNIDNESGRHSRNTGTPASPKPAESELADEEADDDETELVTEDTTCIEQEKVDGLDDDGISENDEQVSQNADDSEDKPVIDQTPEEEQTGLATEEAEPQISSESPSFPKLPNGAITNAAVQSVLED
ncbi:unnamed protein product [Orchesella dallaii]|uniref:Radial spoke head protein 3 n=1 Tax=Orchesella dallaii TaxID=48710 RepID=A0ABP1RSE0_9HEXA